MIDRKLRVLESFKQPGPTANPYIIMLLEALQERCDVRCFTWREALSGRYDVFHVHWPDALISGGRSSRLAARRAMFAALLLRLKLQGIPVVRTLHNPAPHESLSKIDEWLIKRLDHLTKGWIRLNPHTHSPDHGELTTVLLGHYRNWFPADPYVTGEPGRLVNFGLIRPYKGVAELISAFGQCPDPGLRLSIIGAPNTPELRDRLEHLASSDSRVSLTLSHVNDDDLAREVRRASLVVLPYKEMHNSSALLLALSLNRPVLVPESEVTQSLIAEVGPGWVLTYQGDLTPDSIIAASEAAEPDRQDSPDLSQREWNHVAELHLGVFAEALKP